MTGKNPARLFVMVGPPASGKTTCARQIEVAWGALRLTPDEWMIPLFGRDPVLYERDQDVSGFTRHAWFGESEAGESATYWKAVSSGWLSVPCPWGSTSSSTLTCGRERSGRPCVTSPRPWGPRANSSTWRSTRRSSTVVLRRVSTRRTTRHSPSRKTTLLTPAGCSSYRTVTSWKVTRSGHPLWGTRHGPPGCLNAGRPQSNGQSEHELHTWFCP